MPRSDAAQLNIRSRYARDRVSELARASGMTATQIVEEALRAYTPPSSAPLPDGLVRRGRLLVLRRDGPTITHEQAEEAIEASRIERE